MRIPPDTDVFLWGGGGAGVSATSYSPVLTSSSREGPKLEHDLLRLFEKLMTSYSNTQGVP